MKPVASKSGIVSEIASLVAVSLLLAAAAWLVHSGDFPLRADPTAYALDIGYPLVGVPQALQHFESGDHLFIDSRDHESFSAAHIPGAMNLRPDQFDQDLREVFDWIRPEDNYLVYGRDNLKEAAAICARLGERGYTHVAILNGDLEDWRRAGGQISGGDHE